MTYLSPRTAAPKLPFVHAILWQGNGVEEACSAFKLGKRRLFDDVYYAASSWTYPRRLVMQAEWGWLKGQILASS